MDMPTSAPPIAAPTGAAPGRHDCESCPMARVCHPACAEPAMTQGERGRRLLRRGEALFRAGDALQYLYQLRAGSLKIRVTNHAGLEQITAFPATGALLGLDAIESGFHACDAIALEDSLLCALPYAQLLANCGLDPLAARQFHRLIAHDINHCQRLLLTLGRMSTDERIASFLVETSEQMAAHGYSAREFILKMTREDIANYLGMEIETVSRVFSRLQAASLLQVSKRHLKLPDIDALRRMSSG